MQCCTALPMRRRRRRCPLPGAPLAAAALAHPACLPTSSCTLCQWQKYERKVAERSAEQHSALSRSAGLLDSMRKRFASPTTASGVGPAAAAPLLATPRPELSGPAGPSATVAAPPFTANAGAPLETPHSFSVSSLKENYGAELNRTATALFGTAAPATGGAMGSSSSSGFAAAMAGAPGGDSLLQQASSMFLNQVEEMRRKYTAEVERLKVGCVGQAELQLSDSAFRPWV